MRHRHAGGSAGVLRIANQREYAMRLPDDAGRQTAGIYLLLRNDSRRERATAIVIVVAAFRVRSVTPGAIQSLLMLAIGFAVAGLLTAAYQIATKRDADFALLGTGERALALSSVPFLLFAGPFVIVRNVVRRSGEERRPFEVAMLSTIVAGFWSLLCGKVVVIALQALGILQV
jgi:hypothetical protein